MWDEWDIGQARRHLLVRDGAANMRRGADEALINSIHSTIHLLQLCINDSIFQQRMVSDLIAKCRRLCGHFNHSALATTAFKALQDTTEKLVLVQDVPTSWNSTYLMFERLAVLKRTVQLYLAENEVVKIAAAEFQLIERVVAILKPFFCLTKTMSSEITSLSTVIPNLLAVQVLLTKMDDGGVGTTKQALLDSLRTRFFNTDDDDNNVLKLNILANPSDTLPTILDPRYKHVFPNAAFEDAKRVLMNAALDLDDEDAGRSSSASHNPSPTRRTQADTGDDNDWMSCLNEVLLTQQVY